MSSPSDASRAPSSEPVFVADERLPLDALLDGGRAAGALRAVLDAVSEGIVAADASGKLVEWNAAALAMHEIPSLRQAQLQFGEFAALFELRSPSGKLLAVDEWPMSRALRGETFSGMDISIRHLGRGWEKQLSYSGSAVRDERGRVSLGLLTVRDVTARRAAEEQLEHSQRQLEIVVKGANVGVWYCPLPFDRLIWDATVKEHFHLPADAEVTIDLFYERLHPEDREPTRRAIELSIATRESYDIEYRTVSADGTQIKWIRARGRGFYDSAGAPRRFDGVTIDITSNKRAEMAVRDSERRFREMADTAPAMLWVTEPNGECSFLSRGWYDFTGQSLEEGLGYGRTLAVHPDDREAAGRAFRRASERRTEYAIDFRLRRADGEYRWVIDTGRPRFTEAGEFLGFVGSVIDVHLRKEAEARQERLLTERQQLLASEKAARERAEEEGRLKDEFLATLSHELRTPLNAILGWSTLMRNRAPTDKLVNDGVQVIERNARAQVTLIEDLLDMSRIISGRIPLEVQTVDLSQVLRAACEAVKPSADAKGLQLRTEVDVAGAPFPGDPVRLQQVFWNLLSNAVKFTPRGGSVHVQLQRTVDEARVVVEDTGEGIRPDFLLHVFDRFRQADGTTTRRHGGLGLGLAIVKQLVELHGGEVSAASEGVGRGARFVVTLPASSEASSLELSENQPERRSKSANEAPSPKASSLQGVRVLVVDDEPDARLLMRLVLEERGARASVAASAPEALEAFRKSPPDVLVSDIGMPGMDGYELIRRVRELAASEGGTTPAVALTAFARGTDRARALEAGFQAHLAKPADPAQLATVIAELLGTK